MGIFVVVPGGGKLGIVVIVPGGGKLGIVVIVPGGRKLGILPWRRKLDINEGNCPFMG